MQLTVMLLLASMVGKMSCEDTASPSGDTTKGMACIPLFRTYDDPVEYSSTVHRIYIPFPEQLNVNVVALFSNVV